MALNFEMLSGGSHVVFRKRERPPVSEEEKELDIENKRKLSEVIILLRKFRTLALEQKDFEEHQNTLQQAHQLCESVADVILQQALAERPFPVDPVFLAELKKLSQDHSEQDWDSGYAIPPSFSIQNLFRATDDMLVRIEEKTQSLTEPDHVLSEEETQDVLREFLRGTNDLTLEARKSFLEKGTKRGGILSGGAIYLALVKRVVERFCDPSLSIDYFVIAVDKQKKTSAFEVPHDSETAESVLILDDVIHQGGTVITALRTAGEFFPNAVIDCGKGRELPGEFKKRKEEKIYGHIYGLFLDFVDYCEEGKYQEALVLFEEAQKYVKENGVELTLGWTKRRERILQQMPK